MTIRRRVFLKSGGLALVGMGAGLVPMPAFLARAADSTRARNKTLVVVFQRGAADGLNMLVPHAEPEYYARRPTIAIPRPVSGGAGAAVDLDGAFGLHPALAPLGRFWRDGVLGAVTAVGSPDATRSHFDAQDFMESGTPGIKSTRDGWLNRYLQSRQTAEAPGFRAVSLTTQLPRVLRGPAHALAIPDIAGFGVNGGRYGRRVQAGLESIYAASSDPLLAPTARETFDAIEFLAEADPTGYRPADGVEYPAGEFGATMLQIAQLIKAGVGVEIAFAEVGGWDHHVNEGGAEGQLARALRPFGAGIAAFLDDLGPRLDDVVLVTVSEFGRTVAENGNRGTDHGHANIMFVAGGSVRGGRIHGAWPGLASENLYEGRDLALTTDFRDILGPILTDHLGATDLTRVFPGHQVNRHRAAGLFRRSQKRT